MKKLTLSILSMALLSLVLFNVSCSGGKSQLSEKGKLLTSVKWKLDASSTLNKVTENLNDTTGITKDIDIQGSVQKLADLASPVLTFNNDNSDPKKLTYTTSIGEGFLSASVGGYWSFNADESAIIMTEIDKDSKSEKDPVTYNIVELSDKKLALQREGDSSPVFYLPKK